MLFRVIQEFEPKVGVFEGGHSFVTLQYKQGDQTDLNMHWHASGCTKLSATTPKYVYLVTVQ